jgi:hypothetical protein
LCAYCQISRILSHHTPYVTCYVEKCTGVLQSGASHPRNLLAFHAPFLAKMPQQSQPRSAAGASERVRSWRMGPSACIPQQITQTPTFSSASFPSLVTHMYALSIMPGTWIPAALGSRVTSLVIVVPCQTLMCVEAAETVVVQ